MTASVVSAAAALVGSSMASAQVSLDVMTFNIRTAAGRDGDNAWPNRKALLVETIAEQFLLGGAAGNWRHAGGRGIAATVGKNCIGLDRCPDVALWGLNGGWR